MKKVTKFVVNTETFEFNPKKYLTAEDAYLAYDDHDNEEEGIYDTLDEARNALANISVYTDKFSSTLARATTAWIEEREYDDEDGEFLGGANVWDFTFEHIDENIIRIIEREDYNRRITVMTPDEAESFHEEVCETNGEELTEEDVFGQEIPYSGYILYALPSNGEGKAFVYDELDKERPLCVIARAAYEHAYGKELKGV